MFCCFGCITVEPLACLSSTSPFSSSLTALLALTNLMDLDYLNVTSPASFFRLMRSLQPEEAWLMLHDNVEMLSDALLALLSMLWLFIKSDDQALLVCG